MLDIIIIELVIYVKKNDFTLLFPAIMYPNGFFIFKKVFSQNVLTMIFLSFICLTTLSVSYLLLLFFLIHSRIHSTNESSHNMRKSLKLRFKSTTMKRTKALQKRGNMKVIGLDIGTTSISSVVIDSESGEQMETRTIPNNTNLSPCEPWSRQQDADAIFEKCMALISSCLNRFPDTKRIGLTGQMHGMLYVNKNGLAVSPLTTWEDGRGNLPYSQNHTYVQEMKRITGYDMATGFGLATHFYNLKNNLIPKNASFLCTIMDYIAMRLCERKKPISHPSNAAGFGLFNLSSYHFDEYACRNAGIDPSFLPEITKHEYIIGSTQDGIDVAIPIGDNQAGILGLTDNNKDIIINIGTSSQISMISEQVPANSILECRPYIENKYLCLGAGLCGGSAFQLLNDFFRDVLHMFSVDVSAEEMFHYMMKTALESFNAGDALQVKTLFRGKRSDPSVCGSIEGITMSNLTPGNLVLGFYQGVLRELYEYYLKFNIQPDQGRLLLCGNAFRNNPLLRELCEDMFGRKTVLADQKEEAATGAARMACMCTTPG